jgi:hypothetical protein
MPVTIRSADMPGRGRPLAVWRSIEWDDVRHGSPQLVPGPDPLLQVRRSSAPGGSSSGCGRLFLVRLGGARVLEVGEDCGEQLALSLELGDDEALYALA